MAQLPRDRRLHPRVREAQNTAWGLFVWTFGGLLVITTVSTFGWKPVLIPLAIAAVVVACIGIAQIVRLIRVPRADSEYSQELDAEYHRAQERERLLRPYWEGRGMVRVRSNGSKN